MYALFEISHLWLKASLRALSKSAELSVDASTIYHGHRSEIDGLRALAVVPVVLFHAGVPGFAGGFIGVDVFFVISGYLIARILLRESDKPILSTIKKFYVRRIRRILPALILVVSLSTAVAWGALGAAQFSAYLKSVLATLLMVSNLFFGSSTGYFADEAGQLLLLHTWSLSVEEQFYLVFPIIFLISLRLGRWFAGLVLSILAAVSIVYAQALTILDGPEGYFSTGTRAWELLLGGLAALVSFSGWRFNLKFGSTISGLGVVVLTSSMVLLDESVPYPSFITLIPVLATVAIVLFANPSNLAGKFLSIRPMVVIGLISYSMYLWHQPVLAFYRVLTNKNPSGIAALGLLTIVVALSFLSWKFVEIPFRDGRKFSTKKSVTLIVSATGVLLVSATFGITVAKPPAPQAAAVEQRGALTHDQIIEIMELSYDRGKCFIDYDQDVSTLIDHGCIGINSHKPKLIVFGDSFAAHFWPGQKSLEDRSGFEMHQWTAASCRPVYVEVASARCVGVLNEFLQNQVNALGNNDVVILSSRWDSVLEAMGESSFESAASKTVEALVASKARVIVAGSTPQWKEISTRDSTSANERLYHQRSSASVVLEKIAKENGIEFFDPFLGLCNKELLCKTKDSGKFLFLDGGHLSPAGSIYVFGDLLAFLTKNNLH